MRIYLSLFFMLFLISCGGKKKQDDQATTRIMPTDLPTLAESKILASLKNTTWEMPSYKDAGISFKKDIVHVSLSKNSYLSNASAFILAEDNEIVVFNVYTETNNNVFALSIMNPKTIKISVIQEEDSIEGYKSTLNRFGTEMVKKSLF
ncbi:MAG: hypothetical protein ACRCTJ_07305 [Brevinema sp.]